jgi:S-adenosylmethionine:tRNA ribosyltransferase-isomerase
VKKLLTSDFDFDLPDDRIAHQPARPREAARLLRVASGGLSDHIVRDLPGLLRTGDVLIANDTRVIPAQLSAHRGAAKIGITLDRPLPDGSWSALARNARKLKLGDVLDIDGDTNMQAQVAELRGEGNVALRFSLEGDAFADALRRAGALALPPYIDRPQGPTAQDASDYQTVFAQYEGAVAAPTAGLHFTPASLDALAASGIRRETITLHVGAGTFLPMRTENVHEHRMHAERGEIAPDVAARLNAARAAGSRLIAVGTTVLRLLESASDAAGIHPFRGETDIFILPGHRFYSADLLMTNFHLPKSTLFMLVCAFAGQARMRAAYAHAIATGYRFFSYGDSSLLDLFQEASR